MPRLLRALAAGLVLVTLGARAWPGQIDDQFITLAFAHATAATGLPRWSTGELVEACSSPLQLVLATLAVGFGADGDLFVKVLAALSGLALLTFAALRLPRGAPATLVVLALAGWEPLGFWSFSGMETTLFALLLSVGWTTLLVPTRRRSPLVALGALWLAATAHPEGSAHFLIALALSLRREDGRRVALPLLAAWFAWHGLRYTLYGELLPTPFLVKIAANPGFGRQWAQVGGDVATTFGLFAALALGFRLPLAALLPVGIQVAVALRAEPDWMGHARHLLPGMAATAVAWAAAGVPRGLRWPWAAPVVIASTLVEAPCLEHDGPAERPIDLETAPWDWLTMAFDTPQLEDVRWIVNEAPVGSTVMLEDVGMPGNVPRVGVLDTIGLTDRQLAMANLGDPAAEAALTRRLLARPPALVRRLRYGDEGIPHPVPWLRLPEPTFATWPQGTAALYRLTEARPSQVEILDRWRDLHHRYPSQGPLAWELATALADVGQLREAAGVATAMAARFPADPVLQALPAAVFAGFDIEVSGVRPTGLRQISRPIPREEAPGLALAIAVDPPDAQRVEVRWACDGPVVEVDPSLGPTPLPTWVCPGEAARLQVTSTDRRPRAELPERMVVGIVGR